ncbi:fungal-specific transcription factor domain-containing protein [Trichoderma velutinum]
MKSELLEMSPPNNPRLLSPSLQCPHCTKAFSRPSHLDRHQLTHLPPSMKAVLPCPRCDKSFSRRDVLFRHLRASHLIKQPNIKRSMRKSCYRCVIKKRKCERTRPCRGCIESQVPCEYTPPQSGESGFEDIGMLQNSKEGLRSPPSAQEQRELDDLGFGGISAKLSPPAAQDASFPHALHTPVSYSGDEPAVSSCCNVSQDGSFHSIPAEFSPTLPSSSTIFRVSESVAGEIFSHVNDYIPSNDEGMSLNYPVSGLPDFRTTGLDWLSVDMPNFGLNSEPWAIASILNDPNTRSPASLNQSGLDREKISSPHFYQPHTPPTTISQTSNSVNSHSLHPVESSCSGQSWPFDQTRDSPPHRYSLPPLRDILKSTSGNRNKRLNSLVSFLSDGYLPNLSSVEDSNAPQVFGDLHRLLDLYFSRFHDIQPIIHRPTWNMFSCPTILLTSMACVGALLSDDEQDTELSWMLSEICLPMISWLGATDGGNYRDISYLNALCLHQIYSLGSGNRQLYQNADRSRGVLVGSLRGMGLLGSSSWGIMDETQDSTELHGAENDMGLLNRQWLSWVSQEHECRAAWAAFEYDCSLCTLTSRRGAIDLSELPRKLPCNESLWGATSAQAWLALRSHLSISPSLSDTLKDIFSGKQISNSLGTWARRLCSQVIGRLLWDLKQLEVVAMPEHFGLPSLLSAHQQSKKLLLRSLNHLLSFMASPSNTPELISYNISGLLCNYSHLYAAEDIMDAIVYIVRHHISQDSSKNLYNVEVAQMRLRSAFTQDAHKGRMLLWHAAQIVGIANEYLVSTPCEIMRVFMAYIFILAYSTYGPRFASCAGDQAPIRLDLPCHEHTSRRRSVADWVSTGGPAGLGSIKNVFDDGCVSNLSRDAQVIMQRLRCWGLAGKFCKILHVFEIRGF